MSNIKSVPCLARIVAPGYPENQWVVSVIRRGQPAFDVLPGGRITECLPDSWICESLMASPFRSIGNKRTNRYASVEDRYLRPLPGIEDPTQVDERIPESEAA